jgi:hypothetical protein
VAWKETRRSNWSKSQEQKEGLPPTDKLIKKRGRMMSSTTIILRCPSGLKDQRTLMTNVTGLGKRSHDKSGRGQPPQLCTLSYFLICLIDWPWCWQFSQRKCHYWKFLHFHFHWYPIKSRKAQNKLNSK